MLKKGFTLIELLVVIAIIAILAAILFPVFAQAKLAAKKTTGLNQTKQIGIALQLYLNDFDDTYMKYRWNGANGTACTPTGTTQCINPDYIKAVGQYGVTQANVLVGKNARDVIFAKQMLDPYTKAQEVWRAPTGVNTFVGLDMSGTNQDPNFRSYGGQNSYGLNGYLFTPLGTATPYSGTVIEEPSNTAVMVDASYYDVFPKTPCQLKNQTFNPSTGTSYPNYWKNLGNAYYFSFPAPPATKTDAQWMADIDARYNGVLNVVRADTSAKAIATSQLVNGGPSTTKTDSVWDPFKQGCQ